MTIARLSASPLYVERVLRRPKAPANLQISFSRGFAYQHLHSRRRPTTAETIVEWFVPVLTLLGTVAAMWFVASDGWFQLCTLWSL